MEVETIDKRGDWMQTATGGVFWPVDPKAEDISIEDIAHALAMLCRFNGHCTNFYSVAQHSVLVSRNVSRKNRLWGLLHDAAEAYTADIPRPLKKFLPNYKEIEHNVMSVICERFGLSRSMPSEIKRVDNAILADEAAQVMLPAPREWLLPEKPLGIKIHNWPWYKAKEEFLKEFTEVMSYV